MGCKLEQSFQAGEQVPDYKLKSGLKTQQFARNIVQHKSTNPILVDCMIYTQNNVML